MADRRTSARATASTATRSSAPGDSQNIESAEYANIVLDVIYYYEQARRAGMAPLSEGQARTLRAWVKRALPGLLDAQRLPELGHGPLPVPLAPVALLGVVAARACSRSPARRTSSTTTSAAGRSTSSTARSRCTSAHCERWADDRREPGSSLYGITTKFSEGPHFELARFQALAAEAVLRGLGDKPAEEPPPLYAFDPAIGRLTVTTPSYNTALVAVSNGAFPYGGIELARLFDSQPAGGLAHRRPRAGGVRAGGARAERHDRRRLAAPAHRAAGRAAARSS